MADGGENLVFLVEEFQSPAVGDVNDGLQGDIALDDGVVGLLNDTHPALSQDFAYLVSTLLGLWYRHACALEASTYGTLRRLAEVIGSVTWSARRSCRGDSTSEASGDPEG